MVSEIPDSDERSKSTPLYTHDNPRDKYIGTWAQCDVYLRLHVCTRTHMFVVRFDSEDWKFVPFCFDELENALQYDAVIDDCERAALLALMEYCCSAKDMGSFRFRDSDIPNRVLGH